MTPEDTLAQRYLLALCVWREARGETVRGQQLVAQVIVNRSTDVQKRWPRDIVGVVTQKWQFSSFNPTDPNAILWPRPGDVAWPSCVVAADTVLSVPTPLTTANHYHVRGLEPAWANVSKVTDVEGRHVFYCL